MPNQTEFHEWEQEKMRKDQDAGCGAGCDNDCHCVDTERRNRESEDSLEDNSMMFETKDEECESFGYDGNHQIAEYSRGKNSSNQSSGTLEERMDHFNELGWTVEVVKDRKPAGS